MSCFLRSHRKGSGIDIPPAPTPTSPLLCGPSGLTLSDLGNGPGGTTAKPIWKATFLTPDPSTVVALRSAFLTFGMRAALNLAGSRNTWCDTVGTCLNFNASKYEARVRRWTVAGGATAAQAAAITACLADRTAFGHLVDEPNISDFCGSISPDDMNNMGLLYKSIWPGCLTCARIGPSVAVNFGIPAGGYTGIDYLIAQYAAGFAGTPFKVYFDNEKTIGLSLNVGVIPALNFIDGGIGGLPNAPAVVDTVTACFDYLNTGSSSGVIKGSFTGTDPNGTPYACGTLPSKTIAGTKFLCNPNFIKRYADVISADFDAPMAFGYSPFSTPGAAAYFTQWNWNQFLVALRYMLNKCNGRTTFNGLRTAK